jgi:hypothetical protein
MVNQEDFIKLVHAVALTNPGALRTLGELTIAAPHIDPDHQDGKAAPVVMLNHFNLRGGNVWMLYRNICSENAHRMLVLLRTTQLGYITQQELHSFSKTPYLLPLTQEEWRTWNSVVCLHVPNFKPLHFEAGI